MRKIQFGLSLIVLLIVAGYVGAQRPPMFCKQDDQGQLYDCHYEQQTPTVVVRDDGYRKPKGVIQNVYGNVYGGRVNAGYSATIVSGDLGPMLIAANVSGPYNGYYYPGYGSYGNGSYGGGYPPYYGNRNYDYGTPGYYERYGYPSRPRSYNQRYGYPTNGYPNYGNYGYPGSYPNSRDCNRRSNRWYR